MATAKRAEVQPKATFIFQGTVAKLKAATMKSVPVDERTATVHIDHVLEAPKNLASFSGKDITVQLAARPSVMAGKAYLFHAVGWIFGDSIAVRAVAQEAVGASHAALLARGGDPAEHKANRELKERVDSADLVVFGTVAAVKLPTPQEPLSRALRASEPVSHKPVSEHDPKWREAVVHVASVHKGKHSESDVSVLFPSSTDVRWYKAPKFEPGRQGYFVLHKTTIKESDRVDHHLRGLMRSKAAEKPVEVYTALNPADFQPSAQRSGMRGLLDASEIVPPSQPMLPATARRMARPARRRPTRGGK